MRKNEKGFSVVEVLIVVVLIGLLGTVGWLVYDKQKIKTNNNKTATTQTSENSKPIEENTNKDTETKTAEPTTDSLGYKLNEYKSYSNTTHSISFKYPGKWSVREQVGPTMDFVSLSMDDEAVPGAGAPDVFTIIITKQRLSAASRRDVHNNNSKDADYTTKLESGNFFSFSGYKFTHGYKDNIEPNFYHFVLDTKGAPTEVQLSMQWFDYAKDEKVIQLGLDILSKGKLGK